MKQVTPDEAGIPQRATIHLPAGALPHDHVIAFGVAGDCMNGDRIADGDLVIVDPGRAPQHGDIGVFMIKNRRGGPVTVLKRLDLSQGTRLLPSSPAHAPIIIDNDQDVVTIGTVIASVHPMADQPAPPQQVSPTVTCPRSPGWAGSRRRAGGGGDPES